ncbi:MAG: hypothetical protein HYT11_00270 [Candidatus Levybacteria bacterium]|nr:hypothetical protein [Candidatus Levybacteria bacterium]
MNSNKQIATSSFTLLYYRFKDSPIYSVLVFLVVIFTCIVLIWTVVIPLTQEWFSIRREIAETEEKIKTIKNNIQIMQGLDKTGLEDKIDTAVSAVPADKDFFGIVTVIADSAVKSGVLLGNFSFAPGTLATESATTGDSQLPIDVSVPIEGEIDNVRSFLKEINEKLPLSQSELLSAASGSTTEAKLKLIFQYKEFPLITYTYTEPIKSFTEEELSLLEQLSSWKLSLVEKFASADVSLPPPL